MAEMIAGNSGTARSIVLVVDDDEVTADQFARMLRGEGFRVQVAFDAETGLAAVNARRPDAILVDLHMPLVDGLEFLERVRVVDQRVPVTIVTGDYFMDDATGTRLRALGAEIQFKPLWLEDLIPLVHGMLRAAPAPPGGGHAS